MLRVSSASITEMNEQMMAQTSASTESLTPKVQSLACATDEHDARLDRVSGVLGNLIQAMTRLVLKMRAARRSLILYFCVVASWYLSRRSLYLPEKSGQPNNQIIQLLIAQQKNAPNPNTRFTWFQPPIRFENALGVILPVLAEYSTEVRFSPAATVLADNKNSSFTLS